MVGDGPVRCRLPRAAAMSGCQQWPGPVCLLRLELEFDEMMRQIG